MDKYLKYHSPLKYYYLFLFLGSAFFVSKYTYVFAVLILLAVMSFSYYLVLSNNRKTFIWGAFYKNVAISLLLSFLYVVILLSVSVDLTIFSTLVLNTLQVFVIVSTFLMLPSALYYVFHRKNINE